MDVRAENRGRPHQKVCFPAAPVMARNFLTPGHPGVRVRNVRGNSGPKSLCLCCFFVPEVRAVNLLYVVNLLRTVIHYSKCGESLHFVLIYCRAQNNYLLGFISCEIFTVISLEKGVGWEMFTMISGESPGRKHWPLRVILVWQGYF